MLQIVAKWPSGNRVKASCQLVVASCQLPRTTRARYKNCILKVISSFAACHCELRAARCRRRVAVDKRFVRHFVFFFFCCCRR